MNPYSQYLVLYSIYEVLWKPSRASVLEDTVLGFWQSRDEGEASELHTEG